jgi:hypothetical protein
MGVVGMVHHGHPVDQTQVIGTAGTGGTGMEVPGTAGAGDDILSGTAVNVIFRR